MKLIKKTKKRINKNNKITKKNIQLAGDSSNVLPPIENHKTPEEILAEVENSQKLNLPSLSNVTESPIVGKATDMAEEAAVNILDKAGDLIGVDLENKAQTEAQLENIKDTLTDPQTIEKVTEIAKDVTALGVEVGKEILPIAQPLISKVTDSTAMALKKTADAAVTTGVNFLKATPLGIPLIVAQDTAKFAEAGLAAAAAAADITKAASTVTRAGIKSMEQLFKEKKNLIDRTENSINEFTQANPISNNYNNNNSMYNNYNNANNITNNVDKNIVGGKSKRRLFKNKKHKTKRVRFAF